MKNSLLRYTVLIGLLLVVALGTASADIPEKPLPPLPDGVSAAAPTLPDGIRVPFFDTIEDLGGSETLTDFRVLPNLDVIGVGVESNRWFIVRYNADGSRDTTFNGDGIAFTADFGTYPTYTGNTNSTGFQGVAISDFTIDSQGRIIIVGSGSDTSFGPNDSVGMPLIARFTPNGDLDTTFVGDGVGGFFDSGCITCRVVPGILAPSVPEPIYSNLTFQFSFATAVGVDSQGKIILVGQVDNEDITASDAFIYKLNDNGSRDISWTAGPEPGASAYTNGAVPGLVVVNFGASPVSNPNPPEEEEPSEIVIDGSDNVIVVGGVEPQADGYIQDRFGLFRLNSANGTLDTTFGSSLPVTSSPAQFTPSRAMAGGVWTRFRNDSDGNDDLLERINTVLIDSQGRLVVGGQVESVSGTFDSALLRFTDTNANAADTSFGGNGHVVADLPGGGVRDVLVDVVERVGTGKLLAAISTDTNPILYGAARFNENGSLDSSFDDTLLGAGDGDGFITTALGTNADPRAGIGLFTAEGFLLGGFVDQGTGGDIALIEYLPEIDVTGNSNPILTGDTTPTVTDGTDFGPVRVTTGSQANTFTIANSGRLRLDLTGTERVAISGAHAADFAVTTDPAISVAPEGGTQGFAITFDPSDTGIRTATVTIISNDPDESPYTFDIQGQGLPDMTIDDVSVVEGDSGTTDLVFTVSLSLPSPQTISADYTTSDSSATIADNDYAATSASVEFPVQTSEQTIAIPINGDLFVEPDETFFVTLSNEVNAFLLDDTGIGTIENDDSVLVEFSAATGEGNEGDSGINAVTAPVLNLSGAILREPETLELTLADGTATTANNDYEQTSSTITLPAGDYTTLSPVGIPVTALGIVGDTVVENDETLDLTLSTPSAGATLGTTLNSTYTILNDDVLTVEFNQAAGAGNEGDSGTNAIIAPPTLSVGGATLAQAGGVTLAVSDGTATLTDDYTQTDNIITIPAADYTTPTTIDVPVEALGIVGDLVAEGDETVNLALSGSSPFVTLGAQDSSVYTIVNDDVLTVEFSVATSGAPEGDSGTSAIAAPVINVSGAVLDTDQTIGVNLTDGTATTADNDYTQTTNALLIPSGDYTALQTISIPDTVLGIVGDENVEGDETVNLALGTGAAPLVTLGAQDTSVYTIENDDAVSVQFSETVPAKAEGDSGTSALTGLSLTVSGSTLATDETVDIGLLNDTATLADNDYSQTDPAVTIPAGDYSTPQTIVIPVEAVGIVGDLNIEPDEDFSLFLENPTGDLMLGQIVEAGYTILNDDGREIDVSGNGISIANGDTTPETADGTDVGTVERNAGTATQTFTIANTGNVALDLTGTPLVDITGTNAADFTVSAAPITPVIGDGSTTFDITFDPSALGTRTAMVSIANNDADEDPYTFVIQGEGVQPNRQLIIDGSFDAGLTNWNLFGDYGFQVLNGVVEFWRESPGWRGAVLFQEMDEFLPTGAPLRINLALANNSALEKSVVVMLRNPDYSDTITCAVTLPPNSFFQGVTIEDVTTSDWSSAVFSVRVLDQDNTPAVRVDNVSVQYLPTSGINSYSCVGYDTPENTQLIRNGTFSTPVLREWLMFGGYDFTVNGDTLAFYRTAGSAQVAVAYQQIAYQLDAGAPIRAQIEIANTSGVPKDVTFFVRNDAWTDSMRCRYTIPANTTSTTVTIEGDTQTTWEQVAFVVRVNNDDGAPAIEIDNASLIYNPGFTFASTTCVPPTSNSDVRQLDEGEKAPTTILPDAGLQPDSDGAAPAPVAPPNPGGIPEIPGF